MSAPRNYAMETEVARGTKLIADDGFTCIAEDAILTVEAREDGTLFVRCDDGEHCLDGQLEDGGRYIGFTLAPSEATS